MTATHETTARDYEREAEATRHRLADTLSELHDRLTPGDILNEVLSYGRGGGGAVLRAASTAAKQNPIPALLIGAGCAMFMAEKTGLTQRLAARLQNKDGASRRTAPYGNGGQSPGQSFRSAAADTADTIRQQASSLGEGVRSGAASVGGTVSDAASSVGNRVSSAATSVGDRISGAAGSVGDAASSAAQQVRQGARQAGETFSNTASGLAESARDTGQRLTGAASELAQGARDAAQEYSAAVGEQIAGTAERTREQATIAARQVKEKAQSVMEEQPLLVAALALAVGAAVAALLPSTKAEDEFLGETSDSVKETLAEVATEQYQRAKDAAGSVAEQAKKMAAEEGLTPASAADVVRSLGDKVKRVVTETAASAGAEMGVKATEGKQT